jgi:glycosyltransferase involved in cell wall biosynthesis
MRIGIDATNLGSGGSLTHIGELLAAARPEEHGFSRVVVWGSRDVLARLPLRPWLDSVYEPMLDAPLPIRLLWQQAKISVLAHAASCDLLFVPGGTYLGGFRPFVTMSRNLLPFDPPQLRLYGASLRVLKFLLLRFSQSRTVRNADGTIFLNDYGRARVIKRLRTLPGRETIIPHGISQRFRRAPRPQKPLNAYSKEAPFRLLYVSTVDLYKHQSRVAEAVAQLAGEGLPVQLEIVGTAHHAAMSELRSAVRRLHAEEYVHYRGPIAYADLPEVYGECDGFVFASTCENLPNCLLEAMNAGLPIACSDRPPMPNILGYGGVYFDASDTAYIVRAVRHLVTSPEVRQACAGAAYARAQEYSWERCADETFSFLRTIA